MKKTGLRRLAISVIGHLVRDEIVRPDGRTTSALGGIAYNIAALCAIMDREEVRPVCRIGHDIETDVLAAFGWSKSFNPSGIGHTRLPNVVNKLVYRGGSHREEWNSRKPAPLRLNRSCLESDAVLVNFISGNDIRLKDLRAFRRRYKGLIFCDFHSLSLGRDSNGKRYYRRHPRWREYVAAADIVQMNLAELSTIYPGELGNPSEIAVACRILHDCGPKAAIVTAGDKGLVFSESVSGRAFHIPAINLGAAVDPTGCGDTLAAAFIYHFVKTGSGVKSLEIANRHAAAKATFSGLDGFRRLGEIANRAGISAKAKRLDLRRIRA